MIITKRSIILLTSMTIVFAAGIISRVFHTGFPVFDKYLGDALYAVLFYLLLSLFWKQGTPFVKTLLSCGAMIVIETFQLTGIPLKLSLSQNVFPKVVSIVLGTTFGWLDIVAYFAGILGVFLLDQFYISQQTENYKD